MSTVSVAILDDHRSFAEALAMAMNATVDVECVGTASSTEEMLVLTRRHEPDVLILDYQLINENGIECATSLRAQGVTSQLMMLTAHASTDLIQRAEAADIRAVLAKDAPLTDVLATVRELANKPEEPGARTSTANSTVLSRRQREVLELMGTGMDPAAIAERLYISIHTARGHVKDVIHVMGAGTQLEAVTNAIRQGFLIVDRVPPLQED